MSLGLLVTFRVAEVSHAMPWHGSTWCGCAYHCCSTLFARGSSFLICYLRQAKDGTGFCLLKRILTTGCLTDKTTTSILDLLRRTHYASNCQRPGLSSRRHRLWSSASRSASSSDQKSSKLQLLPCPRGYHSQTLRWHNSGFSESKPCCERLST